MWNFPLLPDDARETIHRLCFIASRQRHWAQGRYYYYPADRKTIHSRHVSRISEPLSIPSSSSPYHVQVFKGSSHHKETGGSRGQAAVPLGFNGLLEVVRPPAIQVWHLPEDYPGDPRSHMADMPTPNHVYAPLSQGNYPRTDRRKIHHDRKPFCVRPIC